jgi:glycosyltransferase involved in cell wall biosynthesis
LETFGLPLLEAASLGKPILVLNKPYAHDVLEGYEGVKYVEDNPNEWYKTILDHYISETYCFKPFSRNNLNDWSKLVDLVISKSKGENIQ